MDRIDRKILVELQKYGRITNQVLAERVGLSATPCTRRVKNLEATGVIEGYTAKINLDRIGLSVNAFVNVTLKQPDEHTMRAFEKGIQRFDEVVECYLVSGRQDYLLRVVSSSLKTYERFIRTELTKLPEIQTIESNFAFGQVKTESVLPNGST